MLRVTGSGRGDAPDPPRAPPPAGSGRHALPPLQARPAEHPRAPAAVGQPSAGSRMWPGPAATALPWSPTRLRRPTRAPARRAPPVSPPAPRSLAEGRPARARRGPALPADTEPGPGAQPEGLGEARPSHAGPRAPAVRGGLYPSPHPGRRLPTWTPTFPPLEATSLRKMAPPPKRAPKTRGGDPETPWRGLCPD